MCSPGADQPGILTSELILHSQNIPSSPSLIPGPAFPAFLLQAGSFWGFWSFPWKGVLGEGLGWDGNRARCSMPKSTFPGKSSLGEQESRPALEFSRSFQPSGGAADPVWGLCASLHPNSLWEFTGIRAARGWEEIPLFPVLGDPGLHNSLPRLCLPSSTPKNPPGSRSDPGETPVWDRASPDGEYWEYSPSQTSKIPKFAFNPSLSPSVGLSLFLPSFGIEFPHPHLFLLSLLSSHF